MSAIELNFLNDDPDAGMTSMRREVDWPHVPRVGERVDLAALWRPSLVTAVSWDLDGRAFVELEKIDYNEEEIAELVRVGWEGKPVPRPRYTVPAAARSEAVAKTTL
jgi:hypothetical protein